MKTYKVVYNNCFGGFEISLSCLEYLHEHNGITEEEYQNALRPIKYSIEKGDYWLAAVFERDSGRFHRWIELRRSEYPKEEFDSIKSMFDNQESFESWEKSYRYTEEQFKERKKQFLDRGFLVYDRTFENIIFKKELFDSLIQVIINIPRHNKVLVEAIETLGSDRCSGPCSKLEIQEIYSRGYRIEDYDGKETIHEFDTNDNIHIIDEN